MREILTLQFGQQANYLGTHYWNTQESYFTYAGEDESPADHDVSFRPGIGADGGETYSPRALIYDLKGAFGTLRRENALYALQQHEGPAADGQWSGRTDSLRLPPIVPSPYQVALDAGLEAPVLSTQSVRFWSDYNRVFYHPRSIIQLNEYELHSSLMPFEQWSTGEELFSALDREHDLLDRDLRPFLEECDQLQGIQVLSATDNAWGGFASKYLERINDELGKGCRWIFGLSNTQRVSRERQSQQIANTAQSLYALDSSASLHIPVQNVPSWLPDYVSLDAASLWCTSALQAAAIESVTLPTRLRTTQSGRATFENLEMTLNGDGNRRVTAFSFSAKAGTEAVGTESATNGDTRMTNGIADDEEDHAREEDQLDIELFPHFSLPNTADRTRRPPRRPHVFSRVSSLRGAWRSATDEDYDDPGVRRRQANGPRSSTHKTNLRFPMLTSFAPVLRFQGDPQALAIQASLYTFSDISNRLRMIGSVARRLPAIDEREALYDGLSAMADEYEEGWMSDSEEDED
ncbi:Protein DML1 [Cercospora zeina]